MPSAEVAGRERGLRDWEADKKPAPATAELEAFKRWLGISVCSPTAPARTPAKLELRRSNYLAEMIAAVREALLECLAGLEDCNERSRRHWSQAGVSSQSGCLTELDPEKSALQHETVLWGHKIRWLQEMRLSLEDERARRQAPILGDSEGRSLCA